MPISERRISTGTGIQERTEFAMTQRRANWRSSVTCLAIGWIAVASTAKAEFRFYGPLVDIRTDYTVFDANGLANVDDILIDNPDEVYDLNHDLFDGFVADEHVAHSSVSIVAGTGLTGGGTIAASRTLSVDTTWDATFNSLTLTSLTASRLTATDGDKLLESTNASDWVAGTENEVDIADDGDGSITIGLVNPLIVGKGGTGVATLTDHSILLGSGTDPVTALGAATNGQIPVGSTGADPVLATLTGTADAISVTNGAGSITLDLDGSIADIAALTPTDGHIIVGDGSNWVAESGATARTSLGVGTTDSPTFAGLTTGAFTAGDGGSTNYAAFAADGELTLHGTARVYQTSWLPIGAIRVPAGGSPATEADYGLGICWVFTDGASDTVSATLRVPQSMDRSAAPEWTIGWGTDDDDDSHYATWQLEYLWVAAGEDLSAAAQETLSTNSTAVTQADGLVIATITGIDAPSATDQLLRVRVTRLGAADTLANDAYLVGMGLKYTANGLGVGL